MYRKTYVEINSEKLENNIKQIKKVYSEYKYYFGVVKANAYGHGIESIKYLINGGINYLAVSSLEEALEIRCLDKKIPILILEPIEYTALNDAIKNNITITIDNLNFFKKLKKDNIKIKFHLKIDSGMNRFGIKSCDEAKYIYQHSNESLFLEGIYTHLSNGIKDNKIYKLQIENFKNITKDINLDNIPIIHLDRSLTMEQHEKIPFANGVRLGIIMYGFNKKEYIPSFKRRLLNKIILFKKNKFIAPKLNLETVFTFKTKVIEIKNIKKGEIIGYGNMYSAEKDMRIAILAYGFADFLYIDKKYVSINRKLYEIIVNYMDVTTIIVDETVKVNDEVEIFGNNISTRKAANWSNQNVYKLLVSVTDRVPRVYIYKNKKYEVKYRGVSLCKNLEL